MADKLQAAIRRATLAAHRDVERLDARALDELKEIYRQAAGEIAERIRAHAGPADTIAIQELRSLRDQVEGRLRALAEARDAALNRNIAAAVDLGLKPYTANGVAAAIAAPAAMAINHRAVELVRNSIAADGLQLSDRLWRIDRHARDVVVNRVEQAVVQGQGASQAALEFLARGASVPAEVAAKIGAANATRLAKLTGADLVAAPNNPMDAAMRLFRTEINRAHGEAYMSGGEDVPGFAAWQYLLSPAHPEPDICDLLSSQNLYGLGPGCYPSREKTPWPAHPNTLSFIVIKFAPEVTAADRDGKETPTEALARLTPEQRLGALGKGKTEIYDAGKLRQGMIRTPLASVRRRLKIPLPAGGT